MPKSSKHNVPFFIDRFADPRRFGRVIGSDVPDGTHGPAGAVTRQGIDREGVVGIDHGALRIRPLLRPGWQRAALVYGPFARQNGLMLAAALLNGHHASRTGGLTQAYSSRIKRWLHASGIDPLPRRAARLLRCRKARVLRQMARWWMISQAHNQPPIHENLALGWFASPLPEQPAGQGSAFVIHSNGANNGELWLNAGAQHLKAILGLQNVPVWLVVILSERGAAYYAASLPGASGLPGLPELRPLGINPHEAISARAGTPLYAGLHQSVLGEIGFTCDTRVWGVQVDRADEYASWYGSAHAADRLMNAQRTGLQAGAAAEQGGPWQVSQLGGQQLAILQPGQPSGLVHAMLNGEGGLVWRFQDARNYWLVRLTAQGASLERVEHGRALPVDIQAGPLLADENSLQIVDDGRHFSVHMDGRLLFERVFDDPTHAQASGVGLLLGSAGQPAAHHFEAHPRSVPAPAVLSLPGPAVLPASQPADWDDFRGPPADLHGRLTCGTGSDWRRELGLGSFEVSPSGGAQVCASAQAPNPGRTAYTIPWSQPDYADLRVEIVPPGTQRNQGHKGRAGLIFWQDPDNYLITSTWLDDSYGGASLSSFFYLNGFEDIYDAIWTNVGPRVTWGKPYHMRTVFDGLLYQVFINDEPVLYRSLSDVYPDARRLEIRRAGIVANWEWGDDTGSLFRHFEAHAPAVMPGGSSGNFILKGK